MVLKFLIHRHKAGRPHYDLRLVEAEGIRSWSMLKDPPSRPGERRLAIEREVISAEAAAGKFILEEAFGTGRAFTWDEGEAEVLLLSPEKLILNLSGRRMTGKYELVRMKWYPGNRWLLKKSGAPRRNLA